MPSYYQSGKFKERVAREEKELSRRRKEAKEKFDKIPKSIPDPTCAHLGKEIFKLRTERGMTQVALGKVAGTYQSEIGRIESGRHNLTIKKTKKIVEALGKKLKLVIE